MNEMKSERWKSALRVSIVGAVLALAGCNVCEDLDEKVCNDLGEEDCAYWKSKDQNFTKTATSGRQKLFKSLLFGPGAETCRTLSSHEPSYDAMLKGTKEMIGHMRAADQAVLRAQGNTPK